MNSEQTQRLVDFTEQQLRAIIDSVPQHDPQPLFRAPGDPGYVHGASTSAGTFAYDGDAFGDDAGGYHWAKTQIARSLDLIGISWCGDELIGECGLSLSVDPADVAEAVASEVWEAYCK